MNIFKTAPMHLLGLAALLTMAICSYLFGIRPTLLTAEELRLVYQETKQLQDQVGVLEAENEELRRQIHSRQELIESRFTLTTSPQQPLLETVSQLLTSRELELLNFRENNRATFQETELQVVGSYSNLMRFVHDMRRLDQPARIATCQISPAGSLGNRYTARFKIEFSPRTTLASTL